MAQHWANQVRLREQSNPHAKFGERTQMFGMSSCGTVENISFGRPNPEDGIVAFSKSPGNYL